MNITQLDKLHKIRKVRQIILNSYRSTKQSIWRPRTTSILQQFIGAFRTKYHQKAGLKTSAQHYRFTFGSPKFESRYRHRLRLLSVQCFPLSLQENSGIAVQHRRNPLPNPPIWHSQSSGHSKLHNPFRLKNVIKTITYV